MNRKQILINPESEVEKRYVLKTQFGTEQDFKEINASCQVFRMCILGFWFKNVFRRFEMFSYWTSHTPFKNPQKKTGFGNPWNTSIF